ncbi:leucine-rich repeat domain-containing protein [Oscillatoria sp. FACHB-1407]|uniref:COR domain-containing protein n=1 Tax=Oscillatoria sp. FACHB-1407 TaxID=2692847 RepID=UPI0016848A2D|nr:COR domain-containing protein [Oscillatoria sp. FACHB-1407]MBD2459738.1 leucine-rich repeat domain-containing protein [Oscillatoria sp. FACHB-1407]
MTPDDLLALIDRAADEGWTELDLSGNGLTELPGAIAKLTQLEKLILGKVEKWEWVDNKPVPTLVTNELKALPDELAALEKLRSLDISGNPLEVVPEVVLKLQQLTSLRLVSTSLSDISAIEALTNLTQLYLDNNQISDLKPIEALTNLTLLYLSNNQISDLKPIEALTNLTLLYLYNNQISDLKPIEALTNLTQLSLYNNQISDLKPIEALTNLTLLYLSNNQISDLKPIEALTNLTLLDLENNRITEIPVAIAQLNQLDKLDLRGNPISIPPDILAPKPGETRPDARPILDYYFRTQDPNQTTHLYEAKILIVGEGGSGKTSLARKLLDPDYKLPSETEDTSTQGIDILRWEFTGRNQQHYQVNLWDFGGQEIYHQTHQFFLTERSLYLLVADSRKEDTDHYFWLNIIRLLSNDSPVLLIQNEKQNRTCNLNLRELRAEFESLRPPLSTNLADNRGLSEVQTAIQHNLEDLLPNGIPFPNSWLNVRYALENDGRNYIDFADYRDICHYHGITRHEEMCDLSHFLHSLGICLHFQKDPVLRHRLILKPNWGTTAVYKILDNPKVKQQLGQFCNDDLNNIWQSHQYADMRYELLQLMKEFKVCYEIPRRQGNYIAPHLLSPTPPDYIWDNSQNLILRYRYQGFMPKGILTRFIVEMHELIENVSDPDQALVWRHGVVLNQGRARAEVIERSHDREIRIRLSGNNQRDLLVTLNYEFEKIHKSFDERLNYDTLIPCNCATCKLRSEPYTYTLDRLKQFIDQRRPTIQCYESSEDVNVRRLLDDSIEPTVDHRLREMGDLELDKMSRFLGTQELAERFNINIYNTQHQGDHKPMTEITNNNQGANIANLVNEAKDNAQVTASNFTQTSGVSTTDLLQIINTLRQTVAQLPQETQAEIIVDLEDVEDEIKKPENQRNPTRLKKRLTALLAAASVAATSVAAMNEFTGNVIDLGDKLGIELQLPAAP